jgi:hypothetical protein
MTTFEGKHVILVTSLVSFLSWVSITEELFPLAITLPSEKTAELKFLNNLGGFRFLGSIKV